MFKQNTKKANIVIFWGPNSDKLLKDPLAYCALTFCKENGLTAPADFGLTKGKYGKPFFANLPEVHFSISHSGDFWLCAFGENPLGVDIEKWRVADYSAIARRFFHPEECKAVASGSISTFFNIWTAKESYVKYHGKGLSLPLESFSVVNDGILVSSVCGLQLQSFEFVPGYSAHICSSTLGSIKMHSLV